MTEQNIERRRGDTYPMRWTIKDSSGSVVDITGYTFLMTVDPSSSPSDDTQNLFQLSGTLVDPANGVVEFAPGAPEANIAPGEYHFDIQMTDTSSYIRTIVTGRYCIKQDITK